MDPAGDPPAGRLPPARRAAGSGTGQRETRAAGRTTCHGCLLYSSLTFLFPAATPRTVGWMLLKLGCNVTPGTRRSFSCSSKSKQGRRTQHQKGVQHKNKAANPNVVVWAPKPREKGEKGCAFSRKHSQFPQNTDTKPDETLGSFPQPSRDFRPNSFFHD